MKYFLSLFLLLQSVFCQANQSSSPWYHFDEKHQVEITVDLFLSTTCSHCHKADDFFRDIEKRYPWLIVHRYLINQDKADLHRFYERLKEEHVQQFNVPAIFFCHSHWSGFNQTDDTGKIILEKLQYCRQKIMQEGRLTETAVRVLQQQGKASQVLAMSDALPTKTSVIPLTALMDSFTACSFFCLTVFMSFLFLLSRRTKLEWVGGLIWITTIGMMHFFQQVQADLYFRHIPGLMIYTIIIGGILVLFSSREYVKSMSATLIIGVLVLCGVYFYQQTCLFNVAYAFEQWLANQAYLPNFRSISSFVYQLVYVLPLLAMIFVWNLLRRCRFIKRRLAQYALFARVFLFFVGCILIIYPIGLAQIPLYFVILLLSIVSVLVITKRNKANSE